VFRIHSFPKYNDHDWYNTTFWTFWKELYILAGTYLISVVKLESVGLRHSGLLVWMWVLGTHMIGMFHFWDTLRGDDGDLSDSSDEMGFYHMIWDPSADSNRMLLIVTSVHGQIYFDLLQIILQPVLCDFLDVLWMWEIGWVCWSISDFPYETWILSFLDAFSFGIHRGFS
jgi:hypothetical protein